ncbi:6954_t:CDS:2, partial [Gigaspora rosea]
MNDTFGTSSDNINEMFVSTREALEIIFSHASEKDIRKYEEQLTVINAFATQDLQNRRRDENSNCIFHFSHLTDLYSVRGNIRGQQQYSNAFFDPNAQPQQEPI